MAKITKTIKKRNLKSTSNLQVKNRRTGEVVADVFVKNTQVGTAAQNINSNPFFDTGNAPAGATEGVEYPYGRDRISFPPEVDYVLETSDETSG